MKKHIDEVIKDMTEANASMTVHCLNNFQPLLDALKWLRECISETRGVDATQAVGMADKAIEAAEQVEVSE
ncbi:MAG: hypothetical protein H8E10_09235 [Desulfobacterales bacterium]|nr:hypothetical protein [Desulfobacterales bacterium]